VCCAYLPRFARSAESRRDPANARRAPLLDRPDHSEYNEYYRLYTSKVPDGDIVTTLSDQIIESVALYESVPPEGETFAYAPGKWSIREALGHVIDTERVFALRALCFARQDPAALPSFDQDEWVAVSNAGQRVLADLLEEWVHLRKTNVAMFRSFDEETGLRRGIASEREFSVRSFAWIIAGHELHHGGLLAERYLPGLG